MNTNQETINQLINKLQNETLTTEEIQVILTVLKTLWGETLDK